MGSLLWRECLLAFHLPAVLFGVVRNKSLRSSSDVKILGSHLSSSDQLGIFEDLTSVGLEFSVYSGREISSLSLLF